MAKKKDKKLDICEHMDSPEVLLAYMKAAVKENATSLTDALENICKSKLGNGSCRLPVNEICKKKPIFLVTAIKYSGRKRSVGFFYSLHDAIESVESNASDIHERVYTYAVIERVSEGIYYQVDSETWFEWVDNKYVKCKKPAKYRSTRNFGIG